MRLYAPFLLMFCLVATTVIAENLECVAKDFNADCLDFISDAQKCEEKGEQKGKLHQGPDHSSTIWKTGGTKYKTQKYKKAPGIKVLENEIKQNAYADCRDAINHACGQFEKSCGQQLETDPCKRNSARGDKRTKVVLDEKPEDKVGHVTTVTCSGFCTC